MPSPSPRNLSVPAQSQTNSGAEASSNSNERLASQISMDRSNPVVIPEAPAATVNNNNSSNNNNNGNNRSSPKMSPFRRGHTRSLSHPFSSPFNWRFIRRRNNKKVDREFLDSDDGDDGNDNNNDDDDDDDDFGVGYANNSGRRGSSPRKAMGAEDDLSGGGRCMTCGYLMRFPKSVKTFRCTICQTINDIEPFPREVVDPFILDHPAECSRYAAPQIRRKAVTISVDRTKAIIDGCTSKYLSDILAKFPMPSDEGSSEDGCLNGIKRNDGNARSDNQGLSPNPTTAPRGRSSDAKNGNIYLSPSPPCMEERNMQTRNRSHSDIPGLTNGNQPYRDVCRPPIDREPAHRDTHPLIFQELEDYLRFTFRDCDSLNNSFTFWPPPPPNGPNVTHPKGLPPSPPRAMSTRNPRINWAELRQWYHLVLTAGMSWSELWMSMRPVKTSDADSPQYKEWNAFVTSTIENEMIESRLHLRRTLLKATENLLKRPYRPLTNPENIRFLLILLENPMLHSSKLPVAPGKSERKLSSPMDAAHRPRPRVGSKSPSRMEPSTPFGPRNMGPGYHSAIIKRIVGLLANLPDICHHYLISWVSRYSADHFERIVSLVGGFVTYRLSRQQQLQQQQQRDPSSPTDIDLVPSFASPSANTPAGIHAAINARSPSKSSDKRHNIVVYGDDWQIRAAARVMSMLFTANSANISGRSGGGPGNNHGHLIPISAFYNTLLDYSDLVTDFDSWESRAARFSFCQYPFFLSIWAKIRIMEHDARRQMESKAREAFFDSILGRKAVSQYLVLKVRRECLAEDSLRSVSEVVGTGQEEIKKGLRIEFSGEEGVDAGGLRKEWFLMLVREIFDPNHGLFLYDDESQYCYFNPYCFESSEQFFLVGVLLGLAIYNSTILDIALPPFAFRKLLAAAPTYGVAKPSTSRSGFKSSLDDLAEYRPALANGLRGLLEFEGDVQETFCYDFVAPVDRYGEAVNIPLCPGGEKRPVTNSNRREFVDLYVHYLLDTAVSRQFEPFKRGFYTVCGGNALSLFRPEEIELLVRGSDAPLDVATLRAVATYDNWSIAKPESAPVVNWFWDYWTNAEPRNQRKILSFITGSDRIPAMGETNLVIRLACLGDNTNRYPTASTCFNTLGLYRYETKEKLERMLSEAVINGEGFGLK